MTDELKAALDRRKAECYDDWKEYYIDGEPAIDHSVQRAADNETLADAYVELMARRETSLEHGEFHAPTLAWFEWIIAKLYVICDRYAEDGRQCGSETMIDRLTGMSATSRAMELAGVITALEGWKSKFESCGAFDSPSPLIDETITLDPEHADLRGTYHDISLLLASADELKPMPELEFGKRYRVRVELVEE